MSTTKKIGIGLGCKLILTRIIDKGVLNHQFTPGAAIGAAEVVIDAGYYATEERNLMNHYIGLYLSSFPVQSNEASLANHVLSKALSEKIYNQKTVSGTPNLGVRSGTDMRTYQVVGLEKNIDYLARNSRSWYKSIL